MNEQIRELAEQAELNATLLFNKEKLEKFAELIVRKCAEVCKAQSLHYAEHNNRGSAASAADVCCFLIKDHFGINK